MNIVVCIKILKESLISSKTWFNELISSCDTYALSLALQLKKLTNANVSVISMGPLNTKKALTDLYMTGVDQVYLISDNAFAGSDTLATSYILSRALLKIPHDIILCGDHTDDSATGQVSIQLANWLKYNFLTQINDIRLDNDGVRVFIDNTIKYVSCPLVLTVKNRIPLPFPSLSIIEKSKDKEIYIFDCSYIHANCENCGFVGSPTKLKQLDAYNMEFGKRKRIIFNSKSTENGLKLIQIVNYYLQTDY